MKNSTLVYVLFTFLALFGYSAFAADAAAPGLADSMLSIWKAIQEHGSTALILVPIFQLLRTHEVMGVLGRFSGKWMQLMVALLTTGGFVVDAMASGKNIGQSIITGLFTAGGSMLLFDAIRSIKAKT